jgi:membrane peptidoglycan carboxypeptidase
MPSVTGEAPSRTPQITGRHPVARRRRAAWLVIGALVLGVALTFATWETRGSRIQARVLTRVVQQLGVEVLSGGGQPFGTTPDGPYDRRLGYSRMNEFIGRLHQAGFQTDAQARWSERMTQVADLGLYLPFQEKDQAGLEILDRHGATVFESPNPKLVYHDFQAVPPLVAAALGYIEDRGLLDPRHPQRNPALEWDRLAKALATYPLRYLLPDYRSPGASTLATQLEKVRHSPDGVTRSPTDKLRQIASASLRVYLDGEDTSAARRRILVNYLNALPLAARPWIGEIIGLGNGLEAWYGADFARVNRLLLSTDKANEQPRAEAFRQVLSLLLAQRRPSHYLVDQPVALVQQTDSYLRLLARDGVIDERLRDLALGTGLQHRVINKSGARAGRRSQQAANVVRAPLATLLGTSLYDLDRLDLKVESSIDEGAQEAASAQLRALADPATVQATGMATRRMLDRGDPGRVIYSLSLYERGEGVNWLQVRADNLDQPFNVGEGVKLDLGSTAKLRTLVNYLHVIAELHRKYASASPDALSSLPIHRQDRLSAWVVRRLQDTPGIALGTLLEDAMRRTYSASPAERFFTGQGLHTFHNFDNDDDGRVLSVAESFRRSVNLVFIRMMRDLVHHYTYRDPAGSARALEDTESPLRRVYLERFADGEGKVYLRRFYAKYSGLTEPEQLDALLSGVRSAPAQIMTVLRSVMPELAPSDLLQVFDQRLPEAGLSTPNAEKLYERYGVDRFDLVDRAYLAGVHPLELWLVAYLRDRPEASLQEVQLASAEERLDVYRWLFKTRRKHAQDRRISSIIEREVFQQIHADWQRLGYPFQYLVPSYATSIGASADRPAALADLMGIILNDGVRNPTRRVTRLHFAKGTPYETVLSPAPDDGEQVLAPEVARVLRTALIDTVENGTGTRARGLKSADGQVLVVGGKTGTGDHRQKIYDQRGRPAGDRFISRSATFVFFIGDRHYGVITAHVQGAESGGYGFTSSLATRLFQTFMPELLATLEGGRVRELPTSELLAQVPAGSETN